MTLGVKNERHGRKTRFKYLVNRFGVIVRRSNLDGLFQILVSEVLQATILKH